jgi:hypothetical protein
MLPLKRTVAALACFAGMIGIGCQVGAGAGLDTPREAENPGTAVGPADGSGEGSFPGPATDGGSSVEPEAGAATAFADFPLADAAVDAAALGPPDFVVPIPVSVVQPAEEITDTACKDLLNPQTALFRAFRVYSVPGLHHSLIQMGVADGGVLDRVVFGSTVGTAQFSMQLQPGFVMTAPASSTVCLNYHYLNAGSTPLSTGGELDIWFATPAPGQVHVGLFNFQSDRVSLPPKSKSTIDFSCQFPSPVNVFMILPHMHSLATLLTTSRLSAGDSSDAAVAAWTELDNPTAAIFDPPMGFVAGDGLSTHCEWYNGESSTVVFGLQSYNEMCSLGGFYFPGDGFIYGQDDAWPDGGHGCTMNVF